MKVKNDDEILLIVQAESTSDEATNTVLDSKLRIATGCTLPEIVQLYMDALGAGTFCIHCSGHIEHASTSFAALFDETIYDLQGRNLFDLLDEASALSFSGAISTEVLHLVPAKSMNSSNITIQETVTTKKLRRQLLITGYLKKLTHNNYHLCGSDAVTVPESGIDNNDTGKIITIVEPNESLRFIGTIIPLSNRPESQITIESISSWKRKNANFTILYNTEFVCVDANGCHLLGYSRLDLLGTSGYDYIHVDDLLHVAENHKQLIKLGTFQIQPHRLRTRSYQWVWINCMAVIENQTTIRRVRCNYHVISLENVKKFKESNDFGKKEATEFVSSFSSASSIPRNSQYARCSTNVINNIIYPSSVTSPLSMLRNGSESFHTKDSYMEQANDSLSSAVSEKHKCSSSSSNSSSSSSSCTAKIVIEPLPPKRIRKGPSTADVNLSNSSFHHTSTSHQRSLPEVPPAKRCNQIPLAFIEHYPLPDSKLAPPEVVSSNSSETCMNPTTSASAMTPAALSISPMYQQVWEELQRRSEILRQQVLQKEMELRELHLKRFLASLYSDKC
uniref:PAS domain-containing protein n=1 Tax=Setaria digitata TaxID=48799 RepID=A0A915Q271_9BILA